MAGGQCLDLEADKLGAPARPDLAHIERLQAMKTGALIRYACEAGAILGRANAAQRRALAQFGERLGAAFQIADDLLDVEGEGGRDRQGDRQGRRQGDTRVAAGRAGGTASGSACWRRRRSPLLEPFGADADILREAARFVVRRQSDRRCAATRVPTQPR